MKSPEELERDRKEKRKIQSDEAKRVYLKYPTPELESYHDVMYSDVNPKNEPK